MHNENNKGKQRTEKEKALRGGPETRSHYPIYIWPLGEGPLMPNIISFFPLCIIITHMLWEATSSYSLVHVPYYCPSGVC